MNKPAFMIVDGERCFYPASEGVRLDAEGFGELGVENADKINPFLNAMTMTAQAFDMELVHTLDKHPKETAHFAEQPNYVTTWLVHGIDGTPGSLLHPGLLIAQQTGLSTEFIKGDQAAESPEDDTSYTGALAHQRGETEVLPDYLTRRNIDTVIIGGLALGDGDEHPLCVDSTALDFKRLGFDVTVLTDATEAVLPENRSKCFQNLGKLGIKLKMTSEAIEELHMAYGDA